MNLEKKDTSECAFILASMLTSYPDPGFKENVEILLEEASVEKNKLVTQELMSLLRSYLVSPDKLDDLRSEYIDLFDRGKEVNSLYETEYGKERSLVKGNELVDIAAFYTAFGLEHGGEGVLPEMLDHISVELEFYALMLLKANALHEANDQEGLEIVEDARKKFLKNHLGRFPSAIAARPGVKGSVAYSEIFKFVNNLVQVECKQLGVETDPLHWVLGEEVPPEVQCGGSVGCVK